MPALVTQGPPLAENLRRHLLGQPLVAFRPQATYLNLITAGDKYAVAVKGWLGERGWGGELTLLYDLRCCMTYGHSFCQWMHESAGSDHDTIEGCLSVTAGGAGWLSRGAGDLLGGRLVASAGALRVCSPKLPPPSPPPLRTSVCFRHDICVVPRSCLCGAGHGPTMGPFTPS